MEQNKAPNIFISYSHIDNNSDDHYIEDFKKHIAPLKKKGLVEDWYDRIISAGEDFQKEIDYNLNDADIICLFISPNFLSSGSCTNEINKAIELKKTTGILVVPIILSHCGWMDDEDISKLLALPTDGVPVSTFADRNEAWYDVYSELKKLIEKEIKIKQLEIKEEFKDFLHGTGMLAKAHSQKESVLLDDVFVCTELDKYDNLREYAEKISSDGLTQNLLHDGRIIIAGEDQSGKTTLCKMMFNELRTRNFIPVYVSDKETRFSGKMDNRISKSLRKQYKDIDLNEIDKERIIPIIDDFHHANKKERHVKYLSEYAHCVIIVDDIFGLNIKDETILSSFTTFNIKELNATLRYELVEKWLSLTDKDVIDNYKNIDKNIGLINSTLGKTIGKGIMPAHPFFILSTIVAYETFAMSLDQEITSQGYCYQAFIYFYLMKRGVKNEDVDAHINFLTELAAHLYKEKRDELNPDDFALFMKSYSNTYNLPIKQEILLKNLTEIVSEDSFKNRSFRYPYFYYFFVAKYLSDHIENDGIMGEITKIINNLHVDENAYIAIFLTHHSKNVNIFKEIENIASCLFDKNKPATLTKDEMKFFDEQAHIIINAALPSANMTPEKERKERLNIQDELEQSQEDMVENEHIANGDDDDGKELRRAIKTVEVMGCIIKNRAGSLEKVRLETIFLEAMNVHLRILSHLFDMIKNENEQEKLVDFISERLSILNESGGVSKDQQKKDAEIIFWNLNFFTIFGIMNKIVHSLGSDKLISVSNKVCDEVNTPASFMAKHGILMGYNKNIQIKELKKRIHEKDFSEISKRTTQLMVVNHCSLHTVTYQDRQRIASLLNVSQKKLLSISSK